MKQFSLEEYLKDSSKKVVTRDGREVRIICTDYKSDYPIIGLVTIDKNKELAYNFQKNGEYYFTDKESSLDLFFAPIKREGWINIYGSDSIFYRNIYKTKEDAIDGINENFMYLTTIKIEWEE